LATFGEKVCSALSFVGVVAKDLGLPQFSIDSCNQVAYLVAGNFMRLLGHDVKSRQQCARSRGLPWFASPFGNVGCLRSVTFGMALVERFFQELLDASTEDINFALKLIKLP
jgi:hypothetical protein